MRCLVTKPLNTLSIQRINYQNITTSVLTYDNDPSKSRQHIRYMKDLESKQQKEADVASSDSSADKSVTAKVSKNTMTKKKTVTKKATKQTSKKRSTAKKTKAKAAQAVRYSAEEKAEILHFIDSYDKLNGRGGQTRAAEKFGVSPITIKNWRGKAGKSTAPNRSKGKPNSKMASKIRDLADKLEEFEALEAKFTSLAIEFEDLQNELDAIRKIF